LSTRINLLHNKGNEKISVNDIFSVIPATHVNIEEDLSKERVIFNGTLKLDFSSCQFPNEWKPPTLLNFDGIHINLKHCCFKNGLNTTGADGVIIIETDKYFLLLLLQMKHKEQTKSKIVIQQDDYDQEILKLISNFNMIKSIEQKYRIWKKRLKVITIFATNKQFNAKQQENSVVICRSNFKTTYGPILKQRAVLAPVSPNINPNSATYNDFLAITGIGPKTADAFTKSRDEGGPFKDANDVEKRVSLPMNYKKNIVKRLFFGAESDEQNMNK